ncbi:hypothetical protein STEG23_005780, partial [Scotinomys teguina]
VSDIFYSDLTNFECVDAIATLINSKASDFRSNSHVVVQIGDRYVEEFPGPMSEGYGYLGDRMMYLGSRRRYDLCELRKVHRDFIHQCSVTVAA